jgi:hypothetical protein
VNLWLSPGEQGPPAGSLAFFRSCANDPKLQWNAFRWNGFELKAFRLALEAGLPLHLSQVLAMRGAMNLSLCRTQLNGGGGHGIFSFLVWPSNLCFKIARMK